MGRRVETMASEAPRGVEDGRGEGGDEKRRPWIADEPPGKPRVESGGPTDVEVEPGRYRAKRKRRARRRGRCGRRQGRGSAMEAQVDRESVETRRNASI